jgi:hypothetical protein
VTDRTFKHSTTSSSQLFKSEIKQPLNCVEMITKSQVHQPELTLAVELSNLLLLLSTSCFSLSSSDAISLSLLHNSLQTEGIAL